MDPQLQNDTCHEECFQVTLTTAAGFDTLKCGCRPWIRRVPDNTFLTIKAKSMEALPVMSCSYDIQIHSIGCYGARRPLQETYSINTTSLSSYVTLYLEWSPPSAAIIVEIISYDICTGVSLESDLEMLPLNSGNRRQCSKFNFNAYKQINQTAIVHHSTESLYIQIRAHTLYYTIGNWSELQYDLSMCHQEVDNSYIVGIIIGVSLISLAALICLGASVCIIRVFQHSMWRAIISPYF